MRFHQTIEKRKGEKTSPRGAYATGQFVVEWVTE